jgi:glycosyltransferase involved in cell wall biosynthesis
MTSQPGVALLATRLSVLGHDPCGGSEVVFWEDYEILRSAGVPVRAYGRAVHNGAPVTVLPMRSGLPLISSLEYCGRFLFHEQHSTVIGYNEPTLAGLAPGRAVVRFDWATPLPKYWKLPGWLSRFQRAIYLFPSESERQLFLAIHPLIPRHSAVVIPNAVDLTLFRPIACGEPVARVGFAGQWTEGKGIAQLLDAWSLVVTRLPAAELLLAGGARLWKNVTVPCEMEVPVKRVQGMAEQCRVRMVGEQKRSAMPAFWNSVSVAVVPSLTEAFGLVALEALACGVPVVASAVGGLREIVVDGECGVLVPPGDPVKLAESLVALLTNESLRSRLAEGARRRAEAFSIEHRSQALLALIAKTTEDSDA